MRASATTSSSGAHAGKPGARRRLLDVEGIARRCERVVPAFGIKARDLDAPVRTLSGGNAQRVVVARELADPHALTIAASPPAGIDIAATEFVRGALLDRRATGSGVLLISSDLEEIRTLSDRIVVLYGGRIAGELPGRGRRRDPDRAAHGRRDDDPDAVTGLAGASADAPVRHPAALDPRSLRAAIAGPARRGGHRDALGAAAIVIAGEDVLDAYGELAAGGGRQPANLAATIVRSIPIVVAGIGIGIAFRAGALTSAREGQMILGGLAAAVAALGLPGHPFPLAPSSPSRSVPRRGAAWASCRACSTSGSAYRC